MSNRRAGILMINDMFHNWKLVISSNCVKIIRELETHYYKEWSKQDWEVNKENDDLLDALRYIIYMIKTHSKPTEKKSLIMREFEARNRKWDRILVW